MLLEIKLILETGRFSGISCYLEDMVVEGEESDYEPVENFAYYSINPETTPEEILDYFLKQKSDFGNLDWYYSELLGSLNRFYLTGCMPQDIYQTSFRNLLKQARNYLSEEQIFTLDEEFFLKGTIPNKSLLDRLVIVARKVRGVSEVDLSQVEIR